MNYGPGCTRVFRFEKFISAVYKFVPAISRERGGIVLAEAGSYGVKYFWESCPMN